jgi:hypothetical protein
MPEVFRTASVSGETEALVVHCSSARFGGQFQKFLSEGLRLRKYSVVAVPGGVQALTLIEYLPKFAWAGWRWVKFLSDLEKPRRIVLIGHEECAWYRDLRFRRHAAPARERITGDLKRVAEDVSERFPQACVEAYYASYAGGQTVFETV